MFSTTWSDSVPFLCLGVGFLTHMQNQSRWTFKSRWTCHDKWALEVTLPTDDGINDAVPFCVRCKWPYLLPCFSFKRLAVL